MLGLRFCARAFSSCGKRGPLFNAVHRPLTIAASLVAEHRLQTRRLSNCGSWAQPLRGTWDPPRPGLEPASPALAGRFSTTVPPGKPFYLILGRHFCWVENSAGLLFCPSKACFRCPASESSVLVLIVPPWCSLFSLVASRTSCVWCSPVSLRLASLLTPMWLSSFSAYPRHFSVIKINSHCFSTITTIHLQNSSVLQN